MRALVLAVLLIPGLACSENTCSGVQEAVRKSCIIGNKAVQDQSSVQQICTESGQAAGKACQAGKLSEYEGATKGGVCLDASSFTYDAIHSTCSVEFEKDQMKKEECYKWALSAAKTFYHFCQTMDPAEGWI